jgi:hypothetical protein
VKHPQAALVTIHIWEIPSHLEQYDAIINDHRSDLGETAITVTLRIHLLSSYLPISTHKHYVEHTWTDFCFIIMPIQLCPADWSANRATR